MSDLKQDKVKENGTEEERKQLTGVETTIVSNGEEEKKEEKLAFRINVWQTVPLYLAFFLGCGLLLASPGPALLDLQILTGSTTQEIANIFVGRSCGGLVGGLVVGAISDSINPWLALGVALPVGGVTFALAPCLPGASLAGMVTMFTVHGLANGFYSSLINVVCTKIWGKNQGPWMQGLHMIGVTGAMLAPLVAKPFLSDAVPHVASMEHQIHPIALAANQSMSPANNVTLNDTLKYHHYSQNASALQLLRGGNFDKMSFDLESQRANNNISSINETDFYLTKNGSSQSYVKTLFIMNGALCTLSSIGFWIHFFKGERYIWRQTTGTHYDASAHGKIQKGRSYKIAILTIMFNFYLLLSIYGRGYGNFTMAFTVEYLGWTKMMGALLTSLYWTAYAVTRIAGIFLIARIKPQTLIISDLCISILATLPVVFIVKKHEAVYWVCTLLYGLGNATIFASGFPWLGQYFEMTGKLSSVALVGGLMGDIVGPLVVGYLFEYVTPMGFIYVSLAGASVCLIMMIVMQILANAYKKLSPLQTSTQVIEVNFSAVEKGDGEMENVKV